MKSLIAMDCQSKWYKPSNFLKLVFTHYEDVSSNKGQLQATDSNTCGHYALFYLFERARGKTLEDLRGQRLFQLLYI